MRMGQVKEIIQQPAVRSTALTNFTTFQYNLFEATFLVFNFAKTLQDRVLSIFNFMVRSKGRKKNGFQCLGPKGLAIKAEF